MVVAVASFMLVLAGAVGAQGTISSYAITAQDVTGDTGAAAVALDVADYLFVNDVGLGFGGTSADVFGPGESTVLGFAAPLRNVPGQHDLVISAFVGGLGATDTASVEVEVRSDGPWTTVATFDTAEARDRPQDRQENDHEGVKHFWIDFGLEDDVTEVRLTNLASTPEGFRLDAVEGLHPQLGSRHAFEIRFERYRADASERFLVRLKNLSDVGEAPISGFFLGKVPVNEWMEETENPFLSEEGSFICVAGCAGDADGLPGVSAATWAWSVDGVTPAPAGVGLDPGRQAGHRRQENIDIDTGPAQQYLGGFTFRVTFADGHEHDFDFDGDVVGFGHVGALYQKYTYFSSNPSLSGPRPVHHYEFVEPPPAPVPLLPYQP